METIIQHGPLNKLFGKNCQQQLAIANGQITELTTRLGEIQINLEAKNGELITVQKELDKAKDNQQERIVWLEKENKQALKDLEEKVELEKKKNLNLTKELETNKQKIIYLEIDKKSLNDKLQLKDNDTSRTKIELQETIKNIQTKLNESNNENGDLKLTIQTLTDKYNDIYRLLKEEENKNSILTSEIETNKQTIEALTIEKDSIEKKHSRLEKMLKNALE